jgi:hypothetical protein
VVAGKLFKGMSVTAVMPPTAAAAVPVLMPVVDGVEQQKARYFELVLYYQKYLLLSRCSSKQTGKG